MVGTTVEKRALTDEVPVPLNINPNLTTPSPEFLISLLGKPRGSYTQNDQPITNKHLAGLMQIGQLGPFAVKGLRPAVQNLHKVMTEIKLEQPHVYAKLGTAGMLCCRLQRNSFTKISSHSWGTAIDLKLEGKLDVRGNNKVHYGLTLIAPIFNRNGWVWGAAFRTEDAMHFEVSREKLLQWKPILVGVQAILKRGNKGTAVRLLQEKLNQHGAHLKPDGDFGDRTEQAVKDFQRNHGLSPDGVAGPNTMKALEGKR